VFDHARSFVLAIKQGNLEFGLANTILLSLLSLSCDVLITIFSLFAIEHCILFAPNIGAEHQL
jgi:hypothetical protein